MSHVSCLMSYVSCLMSHVSLPGFFLPDISTMMIPVSGLSSSDRMNGIQKPALVDFPTKPTRMEPPTHGNKNKKRSMLRELGEYQN